MNWPQKANWPPRDWYDWGMLLCGAASVVVVAVSVTQIVVG